MTFKTKLTFNKNLKKRWIPQIFRKSSQWEVFSGKWQVFGDDKIRCLDKTWLNTAESIATAGSKKWDDYCFEASFSFITDSAKPPEGGVIIYTRFKNFRNYYSYHCCIHKKKIELIKRYRGRWETIDHFDYDFVTGTKYDVEIKADSYKHVCSINGKIAIDVDDMAISSGKIGIGTKYCIAEFNLINIKHLK